MIVALQGREFIGYGILTLDYIFEVNGFVYLTQRTCVAAEAIVEMIHVVSLSVQQTQLL